jgi:hypothetical protein
MSICSILLTFLVVEPRPEIIEDTTSSESSILLARYWLEDCRSHERCLQQRTDPDFIPSRLISVGEEPFSALRVVLACELSSSTEYLTLSHCWGGEVPIRLLESNLESFQRDISRRNHCHSPPRILLSMDRLPLHPSRLFFRLA